MLGSHNRTSWPTERVDKLGALLADGFSASQAAAEMGCTRNAIIGVAHRNNLVFKAYYDARRPKAAEPRIAKPRPPAATIDYRKRATVAQARGHRPQTELPELPTPPADPVVAPVEQRRGILELTDATCRWPHGDVGSADFYFCGGPALKGKPYCLHHCRMAYQPPGQRKERAA
jgi:GcrA cell cycle regulator